MGYDRVAEQIYRIPSAENRSNTLVNFFERNRLMHPVDHPDFSYLTAMARALTLQRTLGVPTSKGAWLTYQPHHLRVPNLEAPDTPVNIALGLYETLDRSGSSTVTHAALRLSARTIPADEFYDDLEAVAKNYLERPWIKGVPNRLLGLPDLPAGLMTAGLIGGFLIEKSAPEFTGFPAMAGMMVGIAGGLTGNILAERVAAKRVSDPGCYMVDSKASKALDEIVSHTETVAIQRVVYQALKEAHPGYEPYSFLVDVWEELPGPLYDDAAAEINENKGSSENQSASNEAMDRLIRVALILQEPSL